MTTFSLPWPPSANSYWRTFRGRMIISAKGRQYRKAAIAAIQEQAPSFQKLTGRVCVVVDAFPPDRRKRDLDNISKSLLDAMTAAGVWADDEQIDLLILRRGEIRKGGEIRLAVDLRSCGLCRTKKEREQE